MVRSGIQESADYLGLLKSAVDKRNAVAHEIEFIERCIPDPGAGVRAAPYQLSAEGDGEMSS